MVCVCVCVRVGVSARLGRAGPGHAWRQQLRSSHGSLLARLPRGPTGQAPLPLASHPLLTPAPSRPPPLPSSLQPVVPLLLPLRLHHHVPQRPLSLRLLRRPRPQHHPVQPPRHHRDQQRHSTGVSRGARQPRCAATAQHGLAGCLLTPCHGRLLLAHLPPTCRSRPPAWPPPCCPPPSRALTPCSALLPPSRRHRPSRCPTATPQASGS